MMRSLPMLLALAWVLTPYPGQATDSPRDRFHDPEADAPYKVWESVLALTMQPLVLDPSGTAAVIEWMTDSDADGSVSWGEKDLVNLTVAAHDGLVDVGTFHRVVLEGLRPGHTYRYQVASRRVVALKPYWPERGGVVRSPIGEFRSLDAARDSTRFAVITDTHEKVARIEALMQAVDLASVDFVAHAGDSVNYAVSEHQLKDVFLAPVASALKGSVPLLYVRGNHEFRGPFARQLGPYLKGPEGSYDFARDTGPVHLIAIDTGEDKPDKTNVYAGLNDLEDYRKEQFDRFEALLQAPAVKEAAFTMLLAHQKDFGWLDGLNAQWMRAANLADVDLVIAGHEHRFEAVQPCTLYDNRFPIIVVGQDQFALVEADPHTLKVSVRAADGRIVHTMTLQRRQKNGQVEAACRSSGAQAQA